MVLGHQVMSEDWVCVAASGDPDGRTLRVLAIGLIGRSDRMKGTTQHKVVSLYIDDVTMYRWRHISVTSHIANVTV